MSMIKAEKTVDVTVNYCGKDEPGKVGYYTRKELKLVDGELQNTDKDETIFGYCDQFGYMTQMCYGSSYVDWEEFGFTGYYALQFDEMYFYAGRPLYIKFTELQRAMIQLGLVTVCSRCLHLQSQHGKRGECNFVVDRLETETGTVLTHCICSVYLRLEVK